MLAILAQKVLLPSIIGVLDGQVWPVHFFLEPLTLAHDPRNFIRRLVCAPGLELDGHVAGYASLTFFGGNTLVFIHLHLKCAAGYKYK